MIPEIIKDVLAFCAVVVICWFVLLITMTPYVIFLSTLTDDVGVVTALCATLLVQSLIISIFIWTIADG